ncbi:MAG TPA: SRPBCC domain-containing protein [Bacillales bacterium]|nr:SRPBCC domain-containing protein [Bacillales bacterium]
MPEIKHRTYIRAAPEKVYETLTTGEGWNAWFTDETTVDLNGDIRLRWKAFGQGHENIEDGGPVLKAVPNEAFVFQWSPGKEMTTVSLALEPYREGTLVNLRETGYTTSEKDLAACLDCSVGWGEALTLLKFYLEHGIVCKEDL